MSAGWCQPPILVVSEQREHGTFLRRLLTGLRFGAVERESTRDAALERLRTGQYGVVISDARLESWAGLELVKVIRAEERLRGLPFILVSAAAHQPSVEAAKEAGVSAYVLKPFSTATLEGAVIRAIPDARRLDRRAS